MVSGGTRRANFQFNKNEQLSLACEWGQAAARKPATRREGSEAGVSAVDASGMKSRRDAQTTVPPSASDIQYNTPQARIAGLLSKANEITQSPSEIQAAPGRIRPRSSTTARAGVALTK